MSDRFLASVLPQHETAELYRLMVVGIKEVAVFLMDTRGLITVWNKAAETMKGYGADDVIGQHIEMLYTDEDRAAGRAQQNLEVAADTGFFLRNNGVKGRMAACSGPTWRPRRCATRAICCSASPRSPWT